MPKVPRVKKVIISGELADFFIFCQEECKDALSASDPDIILDSLKKNPSGFLDAVPEYLAIAIMGRVKFKESEALVANIQKEVIPELEELKACLTVSPEINELFKATPPRYKPLISKCLLSEFVRLNSNLFELKPMVECAGDIYGNTVKMELSLDEELVNNPGDGLFDEPEKIKEDE